MVQSHASSDFICQINDLLYEADIVLEKFEELSLGEQCANAWVRIGDIVFIKWAKSSLIEALLAKDIHKQQLWKNPLKKCITEYEQKYV